MSENRIKITTKEQIVIDSVKKQYPNADGTLEAMDEAVKKLFNATIKASGKKYDALEGKYLYLVDLTQKLRENPQLLNLQTT